jgi:hypothetical protein
MNTSANQQVNVLVNFNKLTLHESFLKIYNL